MVSKQPLLVSLPITLNDVKLFNGEITEKKKIKVSTFETMMSSGLSISTVESNDRIQHLRDEITEKDELIEELQKEILELKNIDKLINNNGCLIKKFNENVLEYHNQELTINNNNCRCWWCHHHFDNTPYFLPDSYHKGKYKVFGYFCSMSCALGYNINNCKDDYKVSERTALLKNLYNVTGEIIVAPSYLILEDYGGDLSIEEYRKQNCINSKTFTILNAPVSYIPLVIKEEIVVDF